MRTILIIGGVSLLLPKKVNVGSLFAALMEAQAVERDWERERRDSAEALASGGRDFRNKYRLSAGLEMSIERADDDQIIQPRPPKAKARKPLLLPPPSQG